MSLHHSNQKATSKILQNEKARTLELSPMRKVLIVEDSRPVREMLEYIIDQDPRLKVVGSVESGERALTALKLLRPDVISMDIRLPGINGFETTRQIMAEHPTPIVVVSASVESEDLRISMNALQAGALSVIEKPVGSGHSEFKTIAKNLCSQLFTLSQIKVIRQRFNRPEKRIRNIAEDCILLDGRRQRRSTVSSSFRMMGLAASTGGPKALTTLLGELGRDFPLPILLVQHISSTFFGGFVKWLNDVVPLPVVRAEEGIEPEPGIVYAAPEECHLVLRQERLGLLRTDPVHCHRPSATVLFESMAESLGQNGLGVVLTGMGSDGSTGLKAICEAGGITLGENETTCAVFGMPAAANAIGGISELLPLPSISHRILQLIHKSG